jgi:N-acylneuraminate cytidylyltransferase
MTSCEDFKNAKKLFEREKSDSLVTGTITKRFFWDLKIQKPVNYNPFKRPRRQEFEGLFQENGAFYFTHLSTFKKYKSRLNEKVSLYIMNEDHSVELDEPQDWEVVGSLLKNKRKLSLESHHIKALILDVDGTLTDAGMYYDEMGEALKKFNTRDAHGIKLLEKQGILTCIITAESSPRVHSRMKKLDLKHYFHGIKNKLEVLEIWGMENNITFQEMADGGDDLNDLKCMNKVAISFCPADSVEIVKNSVDYICEKNAGAGAVREFIDEFLLKSND